MKSKFKILVIPLLSTCLILSVLTVFRENFFFVVRPQISQTSYGEELPSDWPSVFFCNGTVYNEPFVGEVGDTITIALVAFNLTDNAVPDPKNPECTCPLGNLVGFDVQMSWDPAILKYVDHTVTVPVEDYPNPVPPSPYAGILHTDTFELKNVVDENDNITNAEPGTMAWFACAIMPSAAVFNGNGTFFTMTFNVTKSGSSVLKLTNVDLAGEGAMSGRVLFHKFDGVLRTADAPIADFTFGPDVGMVDKLVIFNASASYSPVAGVSISKYIWDFDDETNATVSDPLITHSYDAAGDYMVSLVVEDSDGVRSSPTTHELTVVEKRNVKIKEVSLMPAHMVLWNRTVDIEVHVVNDGGVDENCTVKAYYNTTSVNWTNISAADWRLIGEKNVSLPLKRPWVIEHFTWNTTGVPKVNAYYYILINATAVSCEEDIVDNNMISSDAIFVSSISLRDVAVETLQSGWGELFESPLLHGENATFRIIVRNNGVENETAVDVTLYCNGSLLKSWTESLAYGHSAKLTWQELLNPGYYNITVLATIDNDVCPDDNRKEGILHVIRTPQLNFSYSPECVLVNQTVFFDASASFHGESGASITRYKWGVLFYGTPVATLESPNLVNITYRFREKGVWRVALCVTDNHSITYDPYRPATLAYRTETRIDVGEGWTNCCRVGIWNDITYYVNVTSNSTVKDFYFNPDAGPFIQFTVTSSSGTKGVCQVAIPKPLLRVEDGWEIYIEGQQLKTYTIIQDENNTYLYFTYTHSTQTVLIHGTHVIPEFPSTAIIPLYIIISLITLVLAQRKRSRRPKP